MKPSTLLAAFLAITAEWRSLFPQKRTWQRGVRQSLGSLVCMRRRCLSRVIWTNGGQHRTWSAEDFFYARCRWDPQQLFRPILRPALAYCPGRFLGMAVDATRLRKTGRCLPHVSYHRDPLSPPFHTNLMLGLRFLQTSLLVPLPRTAAVAARALPVRFEEVAVVKKPGKRAHPAAWTPYRLARKLHNLSTRLVQTMQALRTSRDEAGGRMQGLVLALDGSFCNRTVFAASVAGVEVIARTRKDAVLCFPPPPGGRRVYAAQTFTPEQGRQHASLLWKTTNLFYGGKRRKIRYKEVPGVLCQGGAQRRRLRLFVMAPTAYRKRQSGRLCYRQPAYLLTSIPQGHAPALLQIRSKSITARRRIPWASVRPNSAIPSPCPNNPPLPSPPIALSCWRPCRLLQHNADRPLPPCPNGAATPKGLPAWIWLLSSARKWSNTPNYSRRST